MDFNINFWSIAGLIIAVSGLLIKICPPEFKNSFYGIKTGWTVISPEIWKAGHRLFAYCYMFIGMIYFILGILEFKTKADIAFIISIIIVWRVSLAFVHFVLRNKYSKTSNA